MRWVDFLSGVTPGQPKLMKDALLGFLMLFPTPIGWVWSLFRSEFPALEKENYIRINESQKTRNTQFISKII